MGSAKKKKRPVVAADKPTPDFQHHPVISGTHKANYFLVLLLLLATALLYGHSLWNPLVFDDLRFFVDANLGRLGSSFFHLDLRWFSYATFGWTYNLVGHDWFWYRLGNLGLHALTSILLFLFFSRLLDVTVQPSADVSRPHWPAFFAVLIFALHPAAVYGVAYLVQRSILMATLFSIATLLCYMEGLVRDRVRWFVLSALFYFLAVFSKEHSIMIPGVAAALTLLLHKPSFALIRRVWLPFALYLVIGTLIIVRAKGLLGMTYEPFLADILAQMSDQQQEINIEHAYGLSVLTQGYLFFKYLLLWVVPNAGWMAIDIRQPFASHFLSWPELPGFILFLAYPVLAIKLLLKGGRQGLLGFGLLFPWILYLTELSTVRIQEPFVLYRSYLWMSGLPIILFSFMGAMPRKAAPVLLAVSWLILAGLAWNRLDTFSSALKLWSDAIDKYQGKNLLLTERGYGHRGNAYEALGRYSEALADYKKSIEFKPKDAIGYYNTGTMYAQLNKYEEALSRYNTAIELKPDYFLAYGNRGALLTRMGRYAEALSDLDRAIQLSPENPTYYSNRATVNFNLGKLTEAFSDLDRAVQLGSENPSYYLDRAKSNLALGKLVEALSDFDRAIQLSPENPSYYSDRARVNFELDKLAEALSDLDRAIQLSPRNPSYYSNRARINFNQKRFQEAQDDYVMALNLYDEALRQDAKNSKVLLKRGFILNMLNRKNEAMESFRRSCDAGNPEACKQLR